MKIEIKNFGPIDHLVFDMDKDLHLIYGQNAIGKSYATYCIYCVIKNIKNKISSVFTGYPAYAHHFVHDFSINFLNDQLKSIKNKTNITDVYIQNIELFLKKILLDNLKNSFQNTFSLLKNLKNRYSDKNYEITLFLEENIKINIFSDEKGLDLKLYHTKYEISLLEKNTKTTKYSFFINNNRKFYKSNIDDFKMTVSSHIQQHIFEILNYLDNNIRDIYYLPASRSGLYQALSAFSPIIAELSQNRFFMKNKTIELPSLSEPLSDYFIDLSTIDKKNINNQYKEIFEAIEEHILKGKVDYNYKTKKITYKPNDINLELNLSEASSMVSEISPIVMYFKHILNNKYISQDTRGWYYSNYIRRPKKNGNDDIDIMFIEEPEAHLHPEVQVKLLEIFAKISKMNIKIFITSHSNYMFNKLNNMLLNGDVDKDKIAIYHLIQGKNGSYQNPEMQVSPDGINDDNFNAVSRQLYEERMKIYEKD